MCGAGILFYPHALDFCYTTVANLPCAVTTVKHASFSLKAG